MVGTLNPTLRQQRTIATPVRVDGFGYWSSKDVQVEFRPAPARTGIVFVRSDLDEPRRIPANCQHRIETPRRTTLAAGRVTVEMVEHVMAALAGLQIDNCEVWVNRPELPGCDGSSQMFVDALDRAGIVEQNAKRSQLIVTDVTRVGNEEAWVEARPSKTGGLSVKYRLDYGSDSPIGRQLLELDITPSSFRRELATARTFLLQEEADWLRSRGLGTRVTYSDVLVFGPEGPIDNPLRFEDECVRHKMLDLIGDLALAGCDIVGQFVARRGGHRMNAELVRAVLAEGQKVEDRRKVA